MDVKTGKFSLTGNKVNIEVNIFLKQPEYLDFFERTIDELKKETIDLNKATILAKNYLLTDIIGLIEKRKIIWEEIKITPAYFASIIFYLVQDKISSRVAKNLLLEVIKKGEDPKQLIKERRLEKISDQKILESSIDEIIKQNPQAIEDYKKGKENALQFLVGQAMAKLRGAADPQELEKLIREKIAG